MVQKIFDRCCGCGACADSCSVGAITMAQDEKGFYKPKVGESCTKCGACLKSCPVEHKPGGTAPLGFFACTAEPETVASSSSGGVFPLLAEEFLAKGGHVFGCGWGADGLPRHMDITEKAELWRLRGSKYVQSDVNGSFAKVKGLLRQGERVLFSGTPCQVAGLKSYLKKDYDGLLTVDFICHGVPSPGVFRTYLAQLEKKQGAAVEAVNFRDKSQGWNQLGLAVTFADGTVRALPAGQDSYYRAFLSNLSLNRVCGECPFNSLPRTADITLGDFWGIERHHGGFPENRGVSCVTVNSAKGQALFDCIRQRLTAVPSSREDIMDGNPFLNGHCRLHKRREKFFAALEAEPFDALVEKCLKPTPLEWAAEVLAYKLGRR